MKKIRSFLIVLLCFSANSLFAQDDHSKHPDTSGPGWVDMFNKDLSNALFPKGIWKVADGVYSQC